MPVTRTSGQGRKLGSKNLATKAVKELAEEYTPAIVLRLAQLGGVAPPAPPAESEQAQIMAMRELLDRAWGKSPMSISGDRDKPLVVDFRWADQPEKVVVNEVAKVIEATIERAEDIPQVVWQDDDAGVP